MKQWERDHTLEFLLAFDGRIHWLERGYSLRFRIRRVPPEGRRPHGLEYSFTLHDPAGRRVVGFDNAHKVPVAGTRRKSRATTADHWHRAEGDKGHPYLFESADKLLADFFAESIAC